MIEIVKLLEQDFRNLEAVLGYPDSLESLKLEDLALLEEKKEGTLTQILLNYL
jgi:hypothetical protein